MSRMRTWYFLIICPDGRRAVAWGQTIYGALRSAREQRSDCAWLLDAPFLRRPDHGRYVVDMLLDFVVIADRKIPAVQVWCDPRHRDAHRDPGLREYLAGRARAEGIVAIIRYNEREAFVLVPPTLADGKWLELTSNLKAEPAHSFAEIAAVCGAAGVLVDPSRALMPSKRLEG